MSAWGLAAALALDAIFGEPDALWRRAPHPVVLVGRAIGWLETRLNRGGFRRAKGVAAIAGLVVGTGTLGWAIESLPVLGPILSALGAAILIAQKSLSDHVVAVADALDQGLIAGRRAVSQIVGRDPETLDEAAVARAAIESAAENFSDGVAAPVFWYAVGGLPGILIYKAVNTADSMIGHRSERYRAFGWAAARLDDLLNLAPARLSGGLIVFAAWAQNGSEAGGAAWRAMRADASKHASPNAGWPEAAMAGGLGLALAGPRVYGGALTDDPMLNAAGRRDATAADIRAAVGLIWRAWGVVFACAAAAALASLSA